MENLKTELIKIRVNEGAEEYVITLSRDGSILFMNFDADEKDKEIYKLSHLNAFIEKINTLS